jgi:hypothetical protein
VISYRSPDRVGTASRHRLSQDDLVQLQPSILLGDC